MDERAIQRHLEAGRYPEAFELLVETLQHKVFRLACSILQDETLAEDTAQEVFLRAWRALCRTRAKERDAGRARLPPSPPASRVRPPPQAYDIDLALNALPARYRLALVLFYYEEKSYEAVAEMLGLPMGTVKTHLHRASTTGPQKEQSGVELFCGVTPVGARPTGKTLRGIYGRPGARRGARRPTHAIEGLLQGFAAAR